MNSFDQESQMAMLDAFSNKVSKKVPQPTSNPKKAIFNPTLDKKQIIRIVPTSDGEFPIKKLEFYYDTGLKNEKGWDVNILSPLSYGETDPLDNLNKDLDIQISNLKSKLEQEDDATKISEIQKDIFLREKIQGLIQLKSVYYIPVIVRDEQDQGVKYWKVSEYFLQSLIPSLKMDGNLIYHPNKGRDIKVWKEKNDKGYPMTEFVLGQESQLAQTEEEINSLRTNHPDLFEQFTKHSFTELKQVAIDIVQKHSPQEIQEDNLEEPVGRDYTSVHKSAPTEQAPTIEQDVEPVKTEEDPFGDLPF